MLETNDDIDLSLVDRDPAIEIMNEFYFSIANEVAANRKKMGYSQTKLAELVGINRVTLAKFETHKKLVGNEILFRLMYLLNISIGINMKSDR